MVLSVCLITYNHEKYIREAIDGILKQKTNFNFEIVIGEDNSPDKTRLICEEYATKHPQLIKLLPKTKNLGMMPNFVRTFNECKGEFIALIEGDDYWTDPEKLQKQVDYLQLNNDCSLSAHDVQIVYENVPEIYPFQTVWNQEKFEFKDVFGCHFLSSLSLVFRRDALSNLPDWFNNLVVGDIPIILILTSKGYGKYFFEKMGVKRKNETGITADPERQKLDMGKLFFEMYQNVFVFINKKHKKLFYPRFARYERSFASAKFSEGNYFLGFKYTMQSVFHNPTWYYSWLIKNEKPKS
jgi:glycosyltransferase involved in cell wall biosynthesis